MITAKALRNPTILAIVLLSCSYNTDGFAPSLLSGGWMKRSSGTTTPAFVTTLGNGSPRVTSSLVLQSYDSGISGERIDDEDEDEEESEGKDNYEEEEDEEDDDDEEYEEDPYQTNQSSEFASDTSITNVDWGGALGTLRERMKDTKEGKTSPSQALYRIMKRESPNEAIMQFVSEAKPDVVTAMSGAVGSLLGGLSNPAVGAEIVVKADGEKLGNLCFQLQMTGYMFRNAEYVLALKDLMSIESNANISQYKEAFDRLDKDGSGYIEASEVDSLLSDVYDGSPPKFEVETFLQYFDSNHDGRVSWEEFEKGLGGLAAKEKAERLFLPGGKTTSDIVDVAEDDLNEEEEDDDDIVDEQAMDPTVSGMIQVELENGKIVEVEAKDYIESLKAEAEALKEELLRESGSPNISNNNGGGGGGSMMDISSAAANASNGSSSSPMDPLPDTTGGITQYIASLGEKNVKNLTAGISSEVVDAMKLLVDYVLDRGGQSSNNKKGKTTVGGGKSTDKKNNEEMEIAGSALQQLALWQLVLGYRLREAEAKGEYRQGSDQ